MNPKSLFKILNRPQFLEFEATGESAGSALDLRDGYIHLSLEAQLERVLSKYYQGEAEVYILEIPFKKIQENIKFEKASSGDEYPHLYGSSIKKKDITNCRKLTQKQIKEIASKWVLIQEAPDENIAEIIKGNLVSSGVPARVSCDNLGGLHAGLVSLASARIYVQNQHLDQAKKILEKD